MSAPGDELRRIADELGRIADERFQGPRVVRENLAGVALLAGDVRRLAGSIDDLAGVTVELDGRVLDPRRVTLRRGP